MNLPVPDGLADRILLRQSRGWRDWLAPRFTVPALAASLMLAVALGISWKPQFGALQPELLAAGIAGHVVDEPKALAANRYVPMATLVSAVQRGGGEIVQALGRATYVDHCPLPGGGKGDHLVFDTTHGKLTLILMPGKRIAHPVRVEKDGLTVSLMRARAVWRWRATSTRTSARRSAGRGKICVGRVAAREPDFRLQSRTTVLMGRERRKPA